MTMASDPESGGAQPGQQPDNSDRQPGLLLRPKPSLAQLGRKSFAQDQSRHLPGCQEPAGKPERRQRLSHPPAEFSAT